MGLDQWAFSVHPEAIKDRFPFDRNYAYNEFYDWRKNRFVHNWMEELYKSLGGENEFNMQLLQLMPEDIDRLEEDTKNGKIKEYDAPGFFFGNQEFENYEYDAIMRFCQAARKELDKGNAVYYESWY